MTKKDYELIANTILRQVNLRTRNYTNNVRIHDELHTGIYMALTATAEHLAEGFTKDNPRFNKDKFLKACGVK